MIPGVREPSEIVYRTVHAPSWSNPLSRGFTNIMGQLCQTPISHLGTADAPLPSPQASTGWGDWGAEQGLGRSVCWWWGLAIWGQRRKRGMGGRVQSETAGKKRQVRGLLAEGPSPGCRRQGPVCVTGPITVPSQRCRQLDGDSWCYTYCSYITKLPCVTQRVGAVHLLLGKCALGVR